MKKLGFTLVELLAVILVLAAVAVISSPIILNLIESSQRNAFQDSIDGVIRAVTLDVSKGTIMLPTTYEMVDGKILPHLEMGGSVEGTGHVYVNEDGAIKLAISNGTYCATKDYTTKKIEVTKGKCNAEDDPILTEDIKLTDKFIQVGSEGQYQEKNGISYFKGRNPHNWILFGRKLWRVVKVDEQGINLIFERSCSGDTVDTCTGSENGSIGVYAYHVAGSNKWNDTNHTMRNVLETWFNQAKLDSVSVRSSLWCIGGVKENTSTFESLECLSSLNADTGSGDYVGTVLNVPVGSIKLSDYVNASSETTCRNTYMGSNHASSNCGVKSDGEVTNYLYKPYAWWTMNANTKDTKSVFVVGENGYFETKDANITLNIRPMIYLKKDASYLSGDGTEEHPYQIK